MKPEEITALVHALGDLVKVLGQATPADKIKIYKELGLRLNYDVNARSVVIEAMTTGSDIKPDTDSSVHKVGVRGGT